MSTRSPAPLVADDSGRHTASAIFQLVLASGQTVIAIESVAGGTANNQEDMRVFAGEVH